MKFEYHFKPVGQGLFATGSIHSNGNTFHWVYDCGSTDSPEALDREVDAYINYLDKQASIDIFIISHFDRDHIAGFAQLIKRVSIEKLILPYVPFYERILIAISKPIVSPEDLRFAIDPVGYIAEISNERLGRIIFMHGERNSQISNDETDRRDDQAIKFDERDPDNHLFTSSVNYIHANNTSSLKIFGLWEFAFYNKPYKDQPALAKSVKSIIQKAPKKDGYFKDADQLIKDLKNFYESQFLTSQQRNDISLVTYAGPINSTHQLLYCCLPLQNDKTSILYLGDISIKKRSLRDIKKHLDNHRWQKIAITQIAHHGAKSSWYKNAASEFSHDYSVYSYGLHNPYKHPRKQVVDDFARMSCTILVNEHQGAQWYGRP